MKKFLLSLAVLAVGAFGASADELYKLQFGVKANQEDCNQYNKTWTLTQDNQEWTITGFSNNTNGWTDIRYGTKTASALSDGSITSTFIIDGTVNEVVLNGRLQKTGTNDNWTSCKLQSSETADFTTLTNDVVIEKSEFTTADADVTVALTTPATNQYFRLYIEQPSKVATNNGWFALKSMTFNGTPAVAPAVSQPSIKLVEGDYGFKVELSCETEGAEIRYTTNGDEPTEASMLYTVPFDVWENVTVKAIAIKGEDKSAVATKALEVPMILDDLSGLAGADEETIEAMGGSVKFILKGKLTYVWQGNNNLYLTDGTYYVKCFGYNQPTYAAGDTFTRLEGTYAFRYTQPQVTNFTLSEATAGTNVIKPLEVEDLSYIASYNDNRWFTIKGVTISEVSGKSAKMTDAEGNTAVIYNDLGCEGLAEGKNMTVTGFVGLHTSGVQFLPTEIVNEAGEEVVAEPVFSLESGEYTENTEIVISCPTEGATIVYSINLGEIIESETSVTITLTENMEIHAYATKEGMADSEVVEMTYTVKAEETPVAGGTAIFDFSPAEFSKITVTPEQSNYPTNNLVVNDKELSVNGVSMTFTKSGTDNRLWTADNCLRMYANNTMTLSVGSEYSISKVTFTFGSEESMALAADMPGTYANGVWTAPAEATRAIQQVKDLTFQPSGKAFMKKIEVEFSNIATGIESVEVEEGAEAVYYNLQGVRVANPENGLYIRVQGKTASKVYVR